MSTITNQKLIYNKALIANSYINMGKHTDAYNLICKIEDEVEGKSLESRKTMVKISEVYNRLGHSVNSNRIYYELNEGKWGHCEQELLDKIKPKFEKPEKITKFAPPPEMSDEFIYVEKKPKIEEMIVLAKFHLERRNSRNETYNLLIQIVCNNEEKSFTSRKVMYQAAQLYEKLGLSEIKNTIESDLKEGKWGPCEKQILNKINGVEKKELWEKTKEVMSKVSKPLPEFTIPSILMMKF